MINAIRHNFVRSKIGATTQLNNVTLIFSKLGGNASLCFAQKIFAKYGVSRWADQFSALVFRHYPGVFTGESRVVNLGSPEIIKRYTNNVNVYNRVVNWTGSVIQTRYLGNAENAPVGRNALDWTRGNRYERINHLEYRTNLFTRADSSERIVIQEKNTLSKVSVSGVQYKSLIYNIHNITHNATFNAATEVLLSPLIVERTLQNIVERNRRFQDTPLKTRQIEVRVGTLKTVRGSQESFRKSWYGAEKQKSTMLQHSSVQEIRQIVYTSNLIKDQTRSSQHGRSSPLESHIFNLFTSANLLERILTQEKNTLSKVSASGIKYNTSLIHNIRNVTNTTTFNATPKDLPSSSIVERILRNVIEKERKIKVTETLQVGARAETVEVVRDSQESFRKSWYGAEKQKSTMLQYSSVQEIRQIAYTSNLIKEAVYRTRSSQHGRSSPLESRIFNLFTSANLLERILIQEKNTLSKVLASGIQYRSLTHNIRNITQNATTEVLLNPLIVERTLRNIVGESRNFQDDPPKTRQIEARVGTLKTVRGSQEGLGKSWYGVGAQISAMPHRSSILEIRQPVYASNLIKEAVYQTRSSQHGRSSSLESRIFNLFTSANLLERILIQEKNTLSKVLASGIQYNTSLIHNIQSITGSTEFNSIPKASTSLSSLVVERTLRNIVEKERNFKARETQLVGTRVKTVEVVRDSRKGLEKNQGRVDKQKAIVLQQGSISEVRQPPTYTFTSEREVVHWLGRSHQERNNILKPHIFSLLAGTNLSIQEKNTLNKILTSSIQYTSLIHNIRNVTNTTTFNATPKALPSSSIMERILRNVIEKERKIKVTETLQVGARAETVEVVRDSQKSMEKGMGGADERKVTVLRPGSILEVRQSPTYTFLSGRENVYWLGSSHQERSNTLKPHIFSLLAGANLSIQEKNTLNKILTSSIQYTSLIHNIRNITHAPIFNATPKVTASQQGSIAELRQPPIYNFLSRREATYWMEGSHQERSNILKPYIFSLLAGVSLSIQEKNTLSKILASNIQYTSLIHNIRNITYNPLFDAMSEVSSAEGLTRNYNEVIEQDRLIFRKPIIKYESVAETERKPRKVSVRDNEVTNGYSTATKQMKSMNDIGTEEIEALAEQVFKILEKRIVIQKDRRGLL